MSNNFPPHIMSLLPDFVAYLDRDLRYCYTNDAYQKALGKTAEELEGHTVFDILPEETLSTAVPHMRRALAGEEIDFHSQEVAGNGSTLWLHVRYVPDTREDGTVGLFAILTDITARREAELQVQRVRLLTHELPSLLAHCDAEERYLYVNRAYAENFNHTPEEVVGQRISDIVPPALYTQIQPFIQRMLAGETIEFEVNLPHPGGSPTWMMAHGLPEKNGDDTIGFFVNISDISKHKELEQLRRQFATGTVRAQEAERKALAQELHDGIAQELAALAVISNMLERKTASKKTESILLMLQEGLQRTVDEIRRLSYGLHPLELAERGLLNAIEEFLNRTRQVHTDVNVTVQRQTDDLHWAPDPDTEISIYRIIQEACSNALRHAEPKNLALEMERQNGYLLGRVRDDGNGFDVERHGSGFGLASMRERATLLGGSLHIESGHQGTCVTFRIPLQPNAE